MREVKTLSPIGGNLRNCFLAIFSCISILLILRYVTNISTDFISMNSISLLTYLYDTVDLHYPPTHTSTLGRLGEAILRQGGITVDDYLLILSS